MRLSARFACFAVVMALAGPALASDAAKGDITVADPWARASIVKNGAAYVTIMNRGAKADRLISAATSVAGKAELHTHVMDGDIVRMRRVAAFEVAAQSHTALKPGGMHIMLMGLKKPLKPGEMIPLTLTFETAGQIEVMAHVRKTGAMSHGDDHDDGKMESHGKKQTH